MYTILHKICKFDLLLLRKASRIRAGNKNVPKVAYVYYKGPNVSPADIRYFFRSVMIEWNTDSTAT